MYPPVDIDHVLLANAMSAGLCLEVVLGIPVRVEDDDRIGRRQVDSEPARLRHDEVYAIITVIRPTPHNFSMAGINGHAWCTSDSGCVGRLTFVSRGQNFERKIECVYTQ